MGIQKNELSFLLHSVLPHITQNTTNFNLITTKWAQTCQVVHLRRVPSTNRKLTANICNSIKSFPVHFQNILQTEMPDILLFEINQSLPSNMTSAVLTHPGRGPPLSRSNTWYGFSSFRKLEISSEPWHPPDLTFTNTSRGCTPGGTMLGSMLGSSITETRPRPTRPNTLLKI